MIKNKNENYEEKEQLCNSVYDGSKWVKANSIPFLEYNYPLIIRLYHYMKYIYFLSRMTKEERASWDEEGNSFLDWALKEYGKDIKNQ